VDPSFTASLSSHATAFSVHRPLCHLGMELTKQNRLPGPRCGAQAALVSASNPDHVMSGCGSSGLDREEKVSWRYCTGTC
jgi:hypothetical protein